MKKTTQTPATPFRNPVFEVSVLIRSSEDAVRLAETLRCYCIHQAEVCGSDGDVSDDDNEYLAGGEELLSLVRQWDSPLTIEARKRISELCCEIGRWVDEGVSVGGLEREWYSLISDALNGAAQRQGSIYPDHSP